MGGQEIGNFPLPFFNFKWSKNVYKMENFSGANWWELQVWVVRESRYWICRHSAPDRVSRGGKHLQPSFRVIKPWTSTNHFLVSYECCYDTFDCSSRNISLSCLTATPRKQKIVSTIMKICEELPNSEFLNFSVVHNVIKHQPSTAGATHS